MISWSPPPSRVYLYGTFAVARLRILASRVKTRGRALQLCVHRQHGVPALVTAIDTERYGVAVIAISPLAKSRTTEVVFGEHTDDPALELARNSAMVA